MIDYSASYHIGREMMLRHVPKPDDFKVSFDPVDNLFDITWRDDAGDQFSFAIIDITSAEELNALAVNLMITR